MEYPPTERREVVETVHGEELRDPYRWLEGDGEAVREWVEVQNEHARAYLDGVEACERLRPRFEDLARTVEYEPVVARPAGGFQRVREPGEDHPVLYHWPAEGERRELVDPNAVGDRETSVDWFVPDGDGSLVVYGVAAGGDEQYDLRVLDVDTGDVVDTVPDAGRTDARLLAWTDGGFYYVRTGAPEGDGQLSREVRFHELGADPADEPVVADGFDPQTWPHLETAAGGERLVVACQEGWDRTDLYCLRHGEASLRPLLVGEDAVFDPTLRGDRLYLRTSLDAPYYRLAALDVPLDGAATPGDLETVVPERDAMLRDVGVTAGHVLAHYERAAVAELEVFAPDGEHVRSVRLPGPGTVDGLDAERGTETCHFRYQSFDRPPTTYRYDAATGDLAERDRPDVTLPDLAVEQEWCESADGTEVPLFVVRRSDDDPEGSPEVLRGYGGFEISVTPTFDRFAVPFLADGGVLAVANLRGGGEFGEAWHHAGRRADKQRTFEDFVAAAEHLVERGYTTLDRLGIAGGSNGGLTVGAALTQRPDLFAACVCRVPLLDMLRFHTSLLGESWTTEYGSPEDPEAFAYIREYSPYQNVEEREYPAVLFTTAEGDTRVDPFHARKMAARLQANSAGDAPVLLRTRDSTGHGIGKPVSQQVREATEEWGFLYEQLDAA